MDAGSLTYKLTLDTSTAETALDGLALRIAELKAEALSIKAITDRLDAEVDSVIAGLGSLSF